MSIFQKAASLWKSLISRMPREFEKGCWPVRPYEGTSPRISDGFDRNGRGGRGHLGVDIMFRRPRKGSVYLPEFTKWYFCPSNIIMAVSCSGGSVVRTLDSRTKGVAVYIRHGRYMSVYRHLKSVVVEPGDVVAPGQVLGIVSHAPDAGKRGINHLHFEIWDTRKARPGKEWNRAMQAVNPEPFLKKWKNS